MSASPPDLNALRREIDQLDERIHDLLMQRAATVARLPQVKPDNGGLFLRPGREAQILRRLLKRHAGPLPAEALSRIWRELISALYRVQGPLRVAVHAPEKSVGYWDLGRDHFGSVTPMSLHRSAHAVLRAVSDEPATVGLLSLPEDGETDPWWPAIAVSAPSAPRVIARLPFINEPQGRLESLSALVVARAAPEPSDEDVSLLVVGIQSDSISRGRLTEMLQKAGLDAHAVAGSGEEGGGQQLLFEIAGFVGADDRRLADAAESANGAVTRVVPIGTYAVTYTPGDRHA
jgi:chorismate mutase-like protein